jgi:hypothetical protein
METQLLEAILSYFKLNQWKRTSGLSKMSPFDKWSERNLQRHIVALATIGMLEKRADTTTMNALYRLPTQRLIWWSKALGDKLTASILPIDLDFRTIYILYVIGMFFLEHQRPPRQTELFYKDHTGRFRGLINEWLEASGAIAEDPFGIAGAPQIHQAVVILARHGFVIERGKKGERRPYLLTEQGLELVKELQKLHWQDWPVRRE